MTHEDIGRASGALLDMLRTGTLTIVHEDVELLERSMSSERKSRSAAASHRRLVNEVEGGSRS